MRGFLEEYGKTILAVIIAIFSLGMGMYFLLSNLNIYYPESTTGITEEISETSKNRPVLIINKNIRIEKGDLEYDAKSYAANKDSTEYQTVYQKYLDFGEAYEDADKSEVCSKINVYGLDDVDVNQSGVYPLMYRVENKAGRKFIKKVSLIVY